MKRIERLGLLVTAAAALAFVVPEAIAVLTTQRANLGAQRLVTVSGDTTNVTTATSYQQLPGARATITVPAGQTARLVARFSAESTCVHGGDKREYCTVRILTDGVEMFPRQGEAPYNFAFDSVADSFGEQCGFSYCGRESHSMDRTSGVLSAGTHTVAVHWGTVTYASVPVHFVIDDWQLTVESWRVS